MFHFCVLLTKHSFYVEENILHGHWTLEGDTLFKTTVNQSPSNTASHPRQPVSLITLLWKPQKLTKKTYCSHSFAQTPHASGSPIRGTKIISDWNTTEQSLTGIQCDKIVWYSISMFLTEKLFWVNNISLFMWQYIQLRSVYMPTKRASVSSQIIPCMVHKTHMHRHMIQQLILPHECLFTCGTLVRLLTCMNPHVLL